MNLRERLLRLKRRLEFKKKRRRGKLRKRLQELRSKKHSSSKKSERLRLLPRLMLEKLKQRPWKKSKDKSDKPARPRRPLLKPRPRKRLNIELPESPSSTRCQIK